VIGRTISHYRIVSQLAAGGMGVVYRAEDIRLGREVAVKCVLEDFANDAQAIQRLRAEARAASALNHGNICTIYDIGEVDGHPFIVMELLKGESLREKLVNGPLKIHKLVEYGIEIADALAAAHTDGIIHRDIKPGNIFVTDRGHVKVLDFGLAKLTARRDEDRSTDETYQMTEIGVTLGTIAYMSPEQATGEELDPRTDLFSLGVVLYECATGQHPFPGPTSAVTLSGILTKAPVAPVTLNREVPLRLQEVINNCLEKDRELRYQSAADLGADLKRVRRDMDSGRSTVMHLTAVQRATAPEAVAPGSDPSVASTPAAVPVADPPSGAKSSWQGPAAGALAATVLLAGGAWYLTSRDVEPAPPAAIPAPATAAPVTPPPAAPAVPPGVSLADAIESRMRLAEASLKGGNYRAALTSSTEVLALDPAHRRAQRVRDDARSMLDRFDRALAEARDRINARDISGASRALDTARRIDPTAPGVTAVGALLSAAASRGNTAVPAATARGTSPATSTGGSPPPAAPEVQPTPPPAQPPVTSPPATSGAPASGALPAPPTTAPVVPEPAPAPVKKAPEGPTPEQDDQAIRQVVASYGRAIETKDLGLFRSIKPNLSSEEERRLQDGFRSVTSQRVELTVTSIARRGDDATVSVRRRDTIHAAGREQTADSHQTIGVSRQKDRWVIVSIR
jgi:hypothetical protein